MLPGFRFTRTPPLLHLSSHSLFFSFSLIFTDSGYDFGYLVKILSGSPLPPSEETFFHMLKIWFPRTYDVKSIVRSLDSALKGGLQEVADDMGVRSSPLPAVLLLNTCPR
jgi:hypothetical protein